MMQNPSWRNCRVQSAIALASESCNSVDILLLQSVIFSFEAGFDFTWHIDAGFIEQVRRVGIDVDAKCNDRRSIVEAICGAPKGSHRHPITKTCDRKRSVTTPVKDLMPWNNA